VARGLTPQQRLAVIREYGTLENGIGEVRWRSTEAQSLWESGERGEWPDRDEFWQVFWGIGLPVLGITEKPPAAEKPNQSDKTEGRQHRPGRHGKEYRGEDVEKVVILTNAAQLQDKKLGRTLRNKTATAAGVTPYMVDLVFELVRHEKLAYGGRKGWLKIGGEFSATPAFVNLHELPTGS
jgi:hypothetical protein